MDFYLFYLFLLNKHWQFHGGHVNNFSHLLILNSKSLSWSVILLSLLCLCSHQGFELCKNFLTIVTGSSFVITVYLSTADSRNIIFKTNFCLFDHIIMYFSESVTERCLTRLFLHFNLWMRSKSLILNSMLWWIVI